jgi:hypothetical protein
MSTQSTTSIEYSSGFYAGVNGSNTIKVSAGTTINPGCGTADGSAWTFGSRQLQVTLTRLDGMITGSLSPSAKKAGSASKTR